jgi:hypothetical protein
MMARKSSEHLLLRFYAPKTPNTHTVSAVALAQSLEALQRLVLILAMRHEGHAPGQRIRPSVDTQARYQLLCELPVVGSFMAPVRIAGAALLSPSDIPAVTTELVRLLTAIGNRSEADLEASIPDETWRRFALDALERLSPPVSTGVELEILNGKAPVFSTVLARPFVERVIRAPTRHKAPGAIVGTFKRIDFVKREITLRHLASSREISGGYSDYVEQALLENPRALLIAYGTIVRNAQGRPISIDTIERIEAVNLDPMRITEFTLGNSTILAREPVQADVTFDEADAIFEAELASLKIKVFSESFSGLRDAVLDELAVVWQRYAQEHNSKLTEQALVLKKRMLDAFKE